MPNLRKTIGTLLLAGSTILAGCKSTQNLEKLEYRTKLAMQEIERIKKQTQLVIERTKELREHDRKLETALQLETEKTKELREHNRGLGKVLDYMKNPQKPKGQTQEERWKYLLEVIENFPYN